MLACCFNIIVQSYFFEYLISSDIKHSTVSPDHTGCDPEARSKKAPSPEPFLFLKILQELLRIVGGRCPMLAQCFNIIIQSYFFGYLISSDIKHSFASPDHTGSGPEARSKKAPLPEPFLFLQCIKNTIKLLAPWAPSTNDCSMSAVLDGPAMKVP
jgi:hypothetical protein